MTACHGRELQHEKGQKTQKKLEFRRKNKLKENRQKAGLKIVFLGVDRDKSGRMGFFGSSGATSGFGHQIGTVPTRSGRLASMHKPHSNKTRDWQQPEWLDQGKTISRALPKLGISDVKIGTVFPLFQPLKKQKKTKKNKKTRQISVVNVALHKLRKRQSTRKGSLEKWHHPRDAHWLVSVMDTVMWYVFGSLPGLQSERRATTDSKTLLMVMAGLHDSFRMSKHIAPWHESWQEVKHVKQTKKWPCIE